MQQQMVSCRVKQTVEACRDDLQPLGGSGFQHMMEVLPEASFEGS